MNLAEMFAFVRGHADTDATDAPDATLTVYARMAYNDILSRRTDWPHLAIEYTFNTAVSQRGYQIDTALSVSDLEYITSVQETTDSRDKLIYADKEDLEEAFGGSSVSTGRPNFFTVYGTQIQLYPLPTGIKTYQVRGSRAAAPWPTDASSVPEIPTRLHDAIPWFMLGQYYRGQEEPGLAGEAMTQFEILVRRHLGSLAIVSSTARPFIWGGHGPHRMGYSQWVKMNTEG